VELTDFEELALTDPRFLITINSQAESFDSEDDTSGSEDPSAQ